MKTETEIGHADQCRIVGWLEPHGLHRDRFELASRRARFERCTQGAASGQEHDQCGSAAVGAVARQLPLGALERFEQQIEILVGRPAGRTHDYWWWRRT